LNAETIIGMQEAGVIANIKVTTPTYVEAKITYTKY
jgi:hypothetical protein